MITQIAISPLRVAQSKKKDFLINLNVFRNTHYRTLSTVKKNYTAHMMPQLKKFEGILEGELVLTVFPKTRRKYDLDNICSVTTKFFQDAMVEAGIIPDDNMEYITKVTFLHGSVDKDNPRVEIEVISPETYNNTKEINKILNKPIGDIPNV